MADRQNITIMGGPEWRLWLRTTARFGTTNAQVNNFINLSGFTEPQMLKDMESMDWTSLEKRLLAQKLLSFMRLVDMISRLRTCSCSSLIRLERPMRC